MTPSRSSALEVASLFTLEDATFRVGAATLLQPLRLEIPEGRVIGLIGHNGSGKSTLLKLLARQQPPSSGGISFRGRPLHSWGHRALARAVAYLPQDTPPTDGMLVRELVALGRYPWHGALGRFGAEDRRKVAEAMALTEVEGFAERQVETLSGGERQRVWLAMLVAQDATCLLLDEPISALDIAHQVEVLALIRRLSRERSLSVIVVLHDINMAARTCDEILALKGGHLLMRGSPGDIMAPERLQAIYGLSLGIMPHPQSGEPIAYVP
ncbi:ATP-binding cassette domain-containing protein [Plastoroseomonas hellenica]|uniref:ATP-binding cassette domain-containing protein n=1 Tax=Plastoroseomonas hellenica TaxID=2687306 RepID=A0ABS5F559_9PROT|nr:ATP-binding cassette domain-containing protein [Plastoroseomonas hellenica]MBR0646339.1 ATP-binding cassette domain-containing protein [Plastoroseomonas hellenica]MBR0667598.1 ATP-binding cassette domain-containing protein [Plastoroseomonas hellenica]